MRRPSTSSETSSVLSGSTAHSFTKEKESELQFSEQQQKQQQNQQDTTTTTATTSPKKKKNTEEGEKTKKDKTKRDKKGLRQKARDMVHDLGRPPTSRQDAKDGRRTLNYAPLGGTTGELMMRRAMI